MSKVRFSDLETRLSLFDDRVILGATYLSTSYKTWSISCSFIGKDKQQIGDKF